MKSISLGEPWTNFTTAKVLMQGYPQDRLAPAGLPSDGRTEPIEAVMETLSPVRDKLLKAAGVLATAKIWPAARE